MKAELNWDEPPVYPIAPPAGITQAIHPKDPWEEYRNKKERKREPTQPWGDYYEGLCKIRDSQAKHWEQWGTEINDMFPVNLHQNPAHPLRWYPHEHSTLKRLREAIREDGLQSPFAQQLIETISMEMNCPTDWKQLARAVLTGGQYLDWLAIFKDECEQQADRNRRNNVILNYDCLAGEGIYASPAVQAQGPPQYFDQVRTIALKAFNRCHAGPTTPINKLIQGANEDFASFVSKVVESCKRKADHTEAAAAEALAKQLIFEEATPTCRTLKAPIKNTDLDRRILACREVNAQGAQVLAMALANALQLNTNTLPLCFNCKMPGQFAKQCPEKGQESSNIKPKPPTPCPKCKRGYHWAKDCRSKTDKEGNPLNSKRGNPQPDNKRGK
ncbi:PREDICTED: endogenous retrovirus group K member 6 Gag polyprotein-like isoform X3 [Chinchilla lanigera]|uniref:endogenous retrovirus group K member 6 Gag polyprotein-like isoform X3 n=1 Tax=Chinchilla lanigera TaxID=34839 RepID=UPI00069888CE|nr:PREDICTED: endogenous retrovirus group K member 6 Gag polyprotein-like isoform X3 [Chinchilla lanigera]